MCRMVLEVQGWFLFKVLQIVRNNCVIQAVFGIKTNFLTTWQLKFFFIFCLWSNKSIAFFNGFTDRIGLSWKNYIYQLLEDVQAARVPQPENDRCSDIVKKQVTLIFHRLWCQNQPRFLYRICFGDDFESFES
jgi:hypothetical protein